MDSDPFRFFKVYCFRLALQLCIAERTNRPSAQTGGFAARSARSSRRVSPAVFWHSNIHRKE